MTKAGELMTRARLEALGLRVVQTSEQDYQLQIMETVVEDGKEVTKPRAVKPTTRQVYDIYQAAIAVSDELAEALTGMSKALAQQEQRHVEQMAAKNRDMDLLAEGAREQMRDYRAHVDEMISKQVTNAMNEGFRQGWYMGATAQKNDDATKLRTTATVHGMLASRALAAKAEDFDKAQPIDLPEGYDYANNQGRTYIVNPNQITIEFEQTPEQHKAMWGLVAPGAYEEAHEKMLQGTNARQQTGG